MATTYSPSASFRPLAAIGAALRNAFEAIVEARSLAGRRYVDDFLRSLSEVQLKEYGFTAHQIAKIREGHSITSIR